MKNYGLMIVLLVSWTSNAVFANEIDRTKEKAELIKQFHFERRFESRLRSEFLDVVNNNKSLTRQQFIAVQLAWHNYFDKLNDVSDTLDIGISFVKTVVINGKITNDLGEYRHLRQPSYSHIRAQLPRGIQLLVDSYFYQLKFMANRLEKIKVRFGQLSRVRDDATPGGASKTAVASNSAPVVKRVDPPILDPKLRIRKMVKSRMVLQNQCFDSLRSTVVWKKSKRDQVKFYKIHNSNIDRVNLLAELFHVNFRVAINTRLVGDQDALAREPASFWNENLTSSDVAAISKYSRCIQSNYNELRNLLRSYQRTSRLDEYRKEMKIK